MGQIAPYGSTLPLAASLPVSQDLTVLQQQPFSSVLPQQAQFNTGAAADTFTSSAYGGGAAPIFSPTTTQPSAVTSPVATPAADGPVNVALLEVYPDSPFDNTFKRDGHDDAVRKTLNRFDPNAASQTFSFYDNRTEPKNEPPTVLGNLNDINAYIDGSSYDTLHTASQRVQQVMQANPSTDVINMSLSLSKKDTYQAVMDGVINNNDPATGIRLGQQMGISAADLQAYYSDPNFANPATRDRIQSPARANIEKGIAAFVDNRMNTATGGETFQSGMAEWQQATQGLADKGIVTIVAAGNAHDSPGFAATTQNGSELNLLAMSNNVISVAASTDNSVNGKPADFSSRGGGGFNPTLAADGTDVPVVLDGRNEKVDGTSFATPTVAAAVARMKETNPNLSFDQIKSILSTTADNTVATAAQEGAGILNINNAVNQAAATAGMGVAQAAQQQTPASSGTSTTSSAGTAGTTDTDTATLVNRFLDFCRSFQ